MTTFRVCSLALSLFALGVILGILCSSCASLGLKGEPMVVADAEQAVWIAWHDVFKRRDRPPRIRWVTGDALNCTQHPSGITGFKTPAGCRGGFTLSPLEVSVALHPDEQLSDTPLVHELLHALQAREGIYDPDHQRPGFQPFDTCGQCVTESMALVKTCRQEDALGLDCTTVMPNPCGECGLVQWTNEQLQRRGL